MGDERTSSRQIVTLYGAHDKVLIFLHYPGTQYSCASLEVRVYPIRQEPERTALTIARELEGACVRFLSIEYYREQKKLMKVEDWLPPYTHPQVMEERKLQMGILITPPDGLSLSPNRLADVCLEAIRQYREACRRKNWHIFGYHHFNPA